jgi:hypothetical protein
MRNIPEIILLMGFGVFLFTAIITWVKTIRLGHIDPVRSRGRIPGAMYYSMTGAMSPFKKETALLHLPTYIIGILFHLGSFFGFGLLILSFFTIDLPQAILYGSALFLTATALSGIALFLKRIFNSRLRQLSHPDDYVSNILVTGFHVIAALSLLHDMTSLFHIYSGILFFYIPVGKLRHIIYFILARLHLAIEFGKKGIWPPGRHST